MNPYRVAPITLKKKPCWRVIGRYSNYAGDESAVEWRYIGKYRWHFLARIRAWFFTWWHTYHTGYFGSFTAEAMVLQQVDFD